LSAGSNCGTLDLVERSDDIDTRVREALGSVARMGDDPAGLAVLGDLLQA
jgi:hypothetical protein